MERLCIMESNPSNFTQWYLAFTFFLGYFLSILFLIEKAVGALVIVMAVPALMAAILLLAEHRSIKSLIAPFAKKINGKGIAFTFVYPLAILLLCATLALVTKQGTLSSNWATDSAPSSASSSKVSAGIRLKKSPSSRSSNTT